MLNNLAVLIAAVAGLIGSLTSFVGMVVVVRRTSPRERKDAAAGAAEKVLMPQNPIVELATTVVDLKQPERGDDDGPGEGQGSHRRSR